MRIQMLKSTIVDLKQVQEGDFVETDQKSALLLIGIGKAMPAPLPQEVVIEAEVKPQTTKPAPKRRKTNDPQPRV
ncbi:MAG: hypothetical protein ACO38Q_05385 [Aquiluna sp.]